MTASPISSSMPALALVSGRSKIARLPQHDENDAAHVNSPNDFRQAFQEHLAKGSDRQPEQQRSMESKTNSKPPTSQGPQQASKSAPPQKKDGGPSANTQPADAIELGGTAASTVQPQTPDAAGAAQAETHQQTNGEQIAGAGAIGAIPASSPTKGDPALALQINTATSDAGDESEAATASEQSQSTSGLDVAAAQAMVGSLPTKLQTDDDAKDSRGGDAQHHDDGGSQPQPAPVNALHSQSASGTSDASKTDATAGVHASDFEAELAKAHSQPVRGAQIQITGSENQRVDIRMMERNGTLSLTVRSADHALSKTLQEHAPELDARLAAEHYRTELWTPTAAKSADARDLANGNRQGSGGNGASTGNNSNSNRQGQQGSKNSEQPAWLQSFEDQAKTIQQRIEYTWHQ